MPQQTSQLLPVRSKPPVLRSAEKGSFANDTMVRRLREDILQRVFKENDVIENSQLQHLNVYNYLCALDKELQQASTTPLRALESRSPNDLIEEDLSLWEMILQPILRNKETWTTAPWLIAEFYFYRRLSEAFAFSFTQYDPFSKQKQKGTDTALDTIKACIHHYNTVMKQHSLLPSMDLCTFDCKSFLYKILLTSLWGNQADLSLWPSNDSQINQTKSIYTSDIPSHTNILQESGIEKNQFLLADDFNLLWTSLASKKSTHGTDALLRRVDIILDNTGLELVTDLLLVQHLLELKITKEVVLHTKKRPIYVSDTMQKDIFILLHQLQQAGGECEMAANKWQSYLTNDIIKIEDHEFFCLPLNLCEMPSQLWEMFHTLSDLIIIKGDANYRRLLEDRAWPLDFPFNEVVTTFPTRIVALRTLKSNIGCGMLPSQIDYAKKQDKQFQFNGQWGVLQFSEASWKPYNTKV